MEVCVDGLNASQACFQAAGVGASNTTRAATRYSDVAQSAKNREKLLRLTVLHLSKHTEFREEIASLNPSRELLIHPFIHSSIQSDSRAPSLE